MAVPTVGLTGGIACGKSTVARFLLELGIPVVDADQIARDVVAPGTEGLAEIVEAFGPEVLLPDGTLDRKKLGDRVFGDSVARAKLNAITHPRIGAASAARMAEIAESGAPYLVYEAALLVENGIHRALAALVVVAASEETQLRRLMARDEIDEAAARARIESQLPLADKVAAADYVIENDGTLEDARERTREVHEQLLERFGGGA